MYPDALRPVMPTYFGTWKQNYNVPPPPDPHDQVKQLEMFRDALKMDLKKGFLKEVNTFIEGGGGYFLTSDVSHERLSEELSKWAPYILFEVHETLPAEKQIEYAISGARMRAGDK